MLLFTWFLAPLCADWSSPLCESTKNHASAEPHPGTKTQNLSQQIQEFREAQRHDRMYNVLRLFCIFFMLIESRKTWYNLAIDVKVSSGAVLWHDTILEELPRATLTICTSPMKMKISWSVQEIWNLKLRESWAICCANLWLVWWHLLRPAKIIKTN